MNLRFVFSLIVSLLSLLPAAAQDLTRNWIRERIFLDAEGKKCVTSVQYFDGIGRETLLLTDGLSPAGGVAGALTGESFAGRTSAKWLPATGLTGFDFLTPERIKPLAVSSHEGDRKHTETTAFDANGNITRLVRWADYAPMLNTAADVLYYTLDGNRPLSISDRGVSLAYAGAFDFKNRGRSGEYAYDGNGRLVSDPYKGMTVTYADWGTPEKITFDDGNHTAFTYTASGFQSYKYCGKYLDRKHGLDLYDYGARLYDPAAAFWTSPDPLCEKYYNISPYAFCNDNPVTFIDPDGRFIDSAWDAANVAMGVTSFISNVTVGNIVGAALDGAGLIVDVAATAIPGIPGGAATAIKALKGANTIENVAIANYAKKSTPKGRTSRQTRLRELGDDSKLGKADRGWIKQERNNMKRKNRSTIRNPIGKVLAHPRGKEAAKSYSYKESQLQLESNHKLQHKYDNNGKRNKDKGTLDFK